MNRCNPHPSPLPEGEGVIDSFEDKPNVVIPSPLDHYTGERGRVRGLPDKNVRGDVFKLFTIVFCNNYFHVVNN